MPIKIRPFRSTPMISTPRMVPGIVPSPPASDAHNAPDIPVWQRWNDYGIGLLRDLVVNLGLNLERGNILILGAGGATRGIAGPLLEMQPRSLCIANRTVERAQDLGCRLLFPGR